MIFPFSSTRPSNGDDDPARRMDRHIANRTQRLSAGIVTSQDFKTVSGALVVSRGRGKYLRINHAINVQTEVPSATANECRRFFGPDNAGRLNFPEFAQLTFDLAEPQAIAADKLKIQAGKYVDRLRSLAVMDPGVWTTDFDGQISYAPICNSSRLAELTGLTIVDAFPAKDIAAGGHGHHLDALPLWLMLADRNPRVANQFVFLVKATGPVTDVYCLPPSDGLDAELPEIIHRRLPGIELIGHLSESADDSNGSEFQTSDPKKMYVNGKRHAELIQAWRQTLLEFPDKIDRKAPSFDGPGESLGKVTQQFMARENLTTATVFRSLIVLIGELLNETIQSLAKTDSNNSARVWVDAKPALQPCLVNQLQQSCPELEIRSFDELGISSGPDPLTAAILGLLHIDQMPANIPWITGASSQRILGRLTPGRPSVWRQLLLEMADFQPHPMKLKDAV